MPSFSFILFMVSEKIFEYFLEILHFIMPRQPIKLSDLDKCRMKRGVLNKHFFKKISNIPNDSAEIANVHFSHYKYVESLSCHSNQSSYPTKKNTHNFSSPLPVDALCVIWEKSASRLQRRCRLKMLMDGRRTIIPSLCILFKTPTAQYK